MKFKVSTFPWRNKYKVKKCFEKSEFIKSNVLKAEKMKNHTWKLFFFSSSLINTSILIRSLDEVDEYSLVLDIVIATNERCELITIHKYVMYFITHKLSNMESHFNVNEVRECTLRSQLPSKDLSRRVQRKLIHDYRPTLYRLLKEITKKFVNMLTSDPTFKAQIVNDEPC